jgi:hypothetical protein
MLELLDIPNGLQQNTNEYTKLLLSISCVRSEEAILDCGADRKHYFSKPREAIDESAHQKHNKNLNYDSKVTKAR